MPYRLVIEVTTEGTPAPARSTILFELPPGGNDADAVVVAKGIRAGFRGAYDTTRVRVVAFEETDITRSVALP